MRSLKAPLKDFLRRRALARAGVAVEVDVALEAAGERSGTWHFDPRRLSASSAVHSYGIGDNVAFDLALIERFGLVVHAFDPTPRSLEWLAQQRLPAQFVVHPFGLAAHDGEQSFAAPAKERSVNFAPESGDTTHALRLPVWRFATIARELGHTHVDLVKIDIEGGEYAVLPDLVASGPTIDQLLIEFHHGEREHTLADTLAAIELLRSCGLRLAHVSRRGLEFTFVRA